MVDKHISSYRSSFNIVMIFAHQHISINHEFLASYVSIILGNMMHLCAMCFAIIRYFNICLVCCLYIYKVMFAHVQPSNLNCMWLKFYYNVFYSQINDLCLCLYLCFAF